MKNSMKIISDLKLFNLKSFSNVLILSLAILSYASCEKNSTPEHNDLATYLSNNLMHELQIKKDIYIVFNQHSCSSCLQKTKKILSNNFPNKTSNIHLVIAGYSKKDINLYLGDLKDRFDIIYDPDRHLNSQPFFEHNNFYVYQFENDSLINYFYYNVGENLDQFEKMMISIGRSQF